MGLLNERRDLLIPNPWRGRRNAKDAIEAHRAKPLKPSPAILERSTPAPLLPEELRHKPIAEGEPDTRQPQVARPDFKFSDSGEVAGVAFRAPGLQGLAAEVLPPVEDRDPKRAAARKVLSKFYRPEANDGLTVDQDGRMMRVSGVNPFDDLDDGEDQDEDNALEADSGSAGPDLSPSATEARVEALERGDDAEYRRLCAQHGFAGD